jgi:hypothetical protein
MGNVEDIFKEINRLYTYLVHYRKRSHLCLKIYAASANELYIFRQCMYIVFILQCQKAQINCKLSKKLETSIVVISFPQ